MDNVKVRVEAVFEFFEKLNVLFFCFYDRDIVFEGENLREINKNLDEIVFMIKEYLKISKIRVLWGIVNLFLYL